MDFEAAMKKEEDIRMLKYDKFFKLVADTMGHDGRLIMDCLVMKVGERFNIPMDECRDSPCCKIAEYYIVSGISMDFMEWLHCDDAPFVKPLHNIGKYFPEFKAMGKNDDEIVQLANKLYGLDLKIAGDCYNEYVYSVSLNFNSFVPIDFEEIVLLKREIDFCKSYGIDYDGLEKKLLNVYGLTLEFLEEVV